MGDVRHTDTRRRVGARGEELAAGYLAGLGMRIVERGFRCRLGELDIIAWDGPVLVFCEVKARRGTRFGPPEAAVTPVKQARIRALAEAYMKAHGLSRARARFDVVGVLALSGAPPEIRHTPDAFR